MGWLSLDRRYDWVTRLWPILRRVKTVSSQWHNDVRGLFLPSTGLIENSLFVGVLSHKSCHSFMHSLDICEKKLSGGILPWVMTAQIPSLAALSAISFPFIPTWLGIQHRLTCLHMSLRRFTQTSKSSTVAGPRFQPETLPHSTSIRPDFSSSRVQYDRGDDVSAATAHVTQTDEGWLILSPSSCTSVALPVIAASGVSILGPDVKPYVPPHLSTTPITSIVYHPTPATQSSAAAGRPHASKAMSVSVRTHAHRSSAELLDPFALCLPVPFSRAITGLDDDILEVATREANIRPPSARTVDSVVVPDVVVDSECLCSLPQWPPRRRVSHRRRPLHPQELWM